MNNSVLILQNKEVLKLPLVSLVHFIKNESGFM